MKCSHNKSGHVSVKFGRNVKSVLVHRLIYTLFVGEIPEGLVVRHLNDIPNDNRLENLRLGTQSDNMKDCIANGHHKPNRKIEIKDQRKIKKLREKMTVKELATKYKVSEKTIRNIINDYYKKGNDK